ncbi:hypothetical protein BGW36DRAFT_385986 [Talaromyces proteolyticus]|uniref:Uncharacterized protein n=1 Tax=Talaromyces proteolyticus TaxID=1131652 RepID=A0AAD4KJP1_9EURO|nr:uncharacterized protein BGW36DRAFT_385986 [Talaromyces proteolyticus]KAH8693154.1 hypothetical protein BGW36DRAFT_385986 [Talaromyces proteolyticus]
MDLALWSPVYARAVEGRRGVLYPDTREGHKQQWISGVITAQLTELTVRKDAWYNHRRSTMRYKEGEQDRNRNHHDEQRTEGRKSRQEEQAGGPRGLASGVAAAAAVVMPCCGAA